MFFQAFEMFDELELLICQSLQVLAVMYANYYFWFAHGHFSEHQKKKSNLSERQNNEQQEWDFPGFWLIFIHVSSSQIEGFDTCMLSKEIVKCMAIIARRVGIAYGNLFPNSRQYLFTIDLCWQCMKLIAVSFTREMCDFFPSMQMLQS